MSSACHSCGSVIDAGAKLCVERADWTNAVYCVVCAPTLMIPDGMILDARAALADLVDGLITARELAAQYR